MFLRFNLNFELKYEPGKLKSDADICLMSSVYTIQVDENLEKSSSGLSISYPA